MLGAYQMARSAAFRDHSDVTDLSQRTKSFFHEYAISHGYQPTQINGKEHFCREPASPGDSLLTRCLTWWQIIQMRYAGTGPVPDFHEDGNENLGIAPQ